MSLNSGEESRYQSFPFDELQTVPRAVLVGFRNRQGLGKQLEGFSVTRMQPQIFEVVPLSQESHVHQVQVSDAVATAPEESR